jgi:biotin transport system substrate-specific component
MNVGIKSKYVTGLQEVGVALVLSWCFALCSQIVLNVPFSPVPISVQPLPLFLAVYFFGKRALVAYLCYYAQGALGMPFFSNFGGGIAHLIGPKGGYLIGFFLSMLFLYYANERKNNTFWHHFLYIVVAFVITHSCGALQLLMFVSASYILVIEASLMPGTLLKIAFLLSSITVKAHIVEKVLGWVEKKY